MKTKRFQHKTKPNDKKNALNVCERRVDEKEVSRDQTKNQKQENHKREK